MTELQMIIKSILKAILFIALSAILYSILSFLIGFLIIILIKHWEAIAMISILSFLFWLNNTEAGERWDKSRWK